MSLRKDIGRAKEMARDGRRQELLGESEATRTLVRDWSRFFGELQEPLRQVVSPNRGLFEGWSPQVRAVAARAWCALEEAPKAFAHARPGLRVLDSYLAEEGAGPFLLGAECTPADIDGARVILDAFRFALPATRRTKYSSILRWLEACLSVGDLGEIEGELFCAEWTAEQEETFKQRADEEVAKLSWARKAITVPRTGQPWVPASERGLPEQPAGVNALLADERGVEGHAKTMVDEPGSEAVGEAAGATATAAADATSAATGGGAIGGGASEGAAEGSEGGGRSRESENIGGDPDAGAIAPNAGAITPAGEGWWSSLLRAVGGAAMKHVSCEYQYGLTPWQTPVAEDPVASRGQSAGAAADPWCTADPWSVGRAAGAAPGLTGAAAEEPPAPTNPWGAYRPSAEVAEPAEAKEEHVGGAGQVPLVL